MNINKMMQKIKRKYYYFFYILYKSIEYTSEALGGKFWTDFKATVSIGVLEVYIFYSILNYYSFITKTHIKLSNTDPLIILMGVVIIGLNYFSFVHSDKWKEYNAEFDKLPKKKNIIGGIIVWLIIIIIIVNIFTSGYLMQKNVLGM